jgi:prephenate dehydrogenase
MPSPSPWGGGRKGADVFDRAALVGVGLIGGSLGMVLRRRRLAGEVVGVVRAAPAIEAARARGAIDRGTTDADAGVRGADLVVLAVPPDLVVSLARRVIPHLRPGALLTDVASVKAEIVRGVEAALPPGGGAVFVGGHPMAGNEGQGLEAAAPDLFEGAVYLLTPTPGTPPDAVRRLVALIRGIGAVPVEMAPEEHDRRVALVSHLPYLVAAALIGATGDAAPSAGPAFLGATRVAGSPVPLWAQICRLNRTQIHRALRAFREELSRLEAALDDGRELSSLLGAAQEARRRLAASGPAAAPADTPPAAGGQGPTREGRDG